MPKPPLPPDATPFHNPFAKLAATRDELPAGPAPLPVVTAAAPLAKGPARAVVRYERKGHGGKEMTRIDQLSLGDAELKEWLKAAKQTLGCGGVVEGEALLLQGDQRGRLGAWLEKRGVRKVSVS